MTTTFSKLQLNTILSALDGQRRNPSSREVALKRIGRHAGALQLARDDLLAAASGLLDGRMDAAAFLASLRRERPAAGHGDAGAEVADAERTETMHGDAEERTLLAPWPVPRPRNWAAQVNRPQTEGELAAIRRAIARGNPLGDERWTQRTVDKLGLESTLRPRGRPKKSD